MLTAALVGCAAATREVARQATPRVAQSGLIALDQPENQKALEDLSHSPGVRGVGHTVGVGVGQGIVDRLATLAGLPVAGESGLDESQSTPDGSVPTTMPTTAQSRPSTRPLAGIDLNRSIGDLFASVGRGIDQSLRPAIAATVRDAVNQGVQAAFGRETQARAGQWASAVGDAVVRQVSRQVRDDLGPAIGATVREQVGPAIGEALRRQVAPAARQVARDSVGGALEGAAITGLTGDGSAAPIDERVARQVSKGATLGVDDAASEIGLAPGIPRQLGGSMDKLMWLAGGLLVVIGLLALGLIVALFTLAYAIWKSRPQDDARGRPVSVGK